MPDIYFCFIKEQYFTERPSMINMLDPHNTSKQAKRTHLCIRIKLNNNNVYIPLRNNLGNPIRKFGKIGFAVPSQKRPNAGLDYRYSLIINDDKYIEMQCSQKLPNAQYKLICDNYELIAKEITVYINKYIKAAKKNRHRKEPLFKVSSLINFHEELGLSAQRNKTSIDDIKTDMPRLLDSEDICFHKTPKFRR